MGRLSRNQYYHKDTEFFFCQSEIKDVVSTLEAWCQSCDDVLRCLENQSAKANAEKARNIEHQKFIDQKVKLGLS